ncbi:hypothetical protein D3C73_973990 [compost metagenome]
MGGCRGRHWNHLAIGGYFLKHDVGNLDGRVVGVFEGVPGGNGSRDIGDLNTDGGVLVAPLDTDGILHYGSPA